MHYGKWKNFHVQSENFLSVFSFKPHVFVLWVLEGSMQHQLPI